MKRLKSVILIWLLMAMPAFSQDGDSSPQQPQPEGAGMSVLLLDTLIRRIDENAVQPSKNQWQFTLKKRALVVVIDEGADRLRVMTPILESKLLDQALLLRLLQANFDSALDARYAIAQDLVWGTFIHPLRELTPRFFLSGVGQVINVAESFGKTYSSGVFVFGGGDSGRLQRELLEKLQKLDPQT